MDVGDTPCGVSGAPTSAVVDDVDMQSHFPSCQDGTVEESIVNECIETDQSPSQMPLQNDKDGLPGKFELTQGVLEGDRGDIHDDDIAVIAGPAEVESGEDNAGSISSDLKDIGYIKDSDYLLEVDDSEDVVEIEDDGFPISVDVDDAFEIEGVIDDDSGVSTTVVDLEDASETERVIEEDGVSTSVGDVNDAAEIEGVIEDDGIIASVVDIEDTRAIEVTCDLMDGVDMIDFLPDAGTAEKIENDQFELVQAEIARHFEIGSFQDDSVTGIESGIQCDCLLQSNKAECLERPTDRSCVGNVCGGVNQSMASLLNNSEVSGEENEGSLNTTAATIPENETQLFYRDTLEITESIIDLSSTCKSLEEKLLNDDLCESSLPQEAVAAEVQDDVLSVSCTDASCAGASSTNASFTDPSCTDICVDASCADTSCTNASCTDASCTDASCVDASCADTSCIDMSYADASCADASCADASCADASCADASCADASCADSSYADASCTNVSSTDVSSVDTSCTDASCSHAACADASTLLPAQWCDDCGRLAGLLGGENSGGECFVIKPFCHEKNPSLQLVSKRFLSEHLPGCSYLSTQIEHNFRDVRTAAVNDDGINVSPNSSDTASVNYSNENICTDVSVDGIIDQLNDVTGTTDNFLFPLNLTDNVVQGCSFGDVSVESDLSSDSNCLTGNLLDSCETVNNTEECAISSVLLPYDNVSGSTCESNANSCVVDIVVRSGITETQPNCDGTNLVAVSQVDLCTAFVVHDDLSNVKKQENTSADVINPLEYLSSNRMIKNDFATSGNSMVQNSSLVSFSALMNVSSVLVDADETNNDSHNNSSDTCIELDTAEINYTDGDVSKRSSKTVGNVRPQDKDCLSQIAESEIVTQKESTSCRQLGLLSSDSLEDVSVGISCGFSALGSVLFEKCKTRLSESNSSRCSVTPAEKCSSHLQECALSDTPLYVQHSSENSPESEERVNIDAEFLIASSSKASVLTSKLREPYRVSSHLPERKLGAFVSQSNPCIVEEADESIGSQDLSLTSASKGDHVFKIPKEKIPSFCDVQEDSVTTTTSAPCSPVPVQGSLSSTGIERRRKISNCSMRRVSFPEDDTHLTSYMDPVDPWERMKANVTSAEVMKAYLSSCASHTCQPITAVVNQIAALPLDIPGRVESFSLRGCKLEVSLCECLEEIFKRVQFINVDLEGCSLSDDTMIPLVDMIEYYDSATQLNISCNTHIGTRGWQACARMLKKTQSVHYLDARSTNLEVNMVILGKALRMGTRLHTLHLENCNLTGRPLVTLTAALKVNDTLVKLYLADNRLGSNDCIQIGNLMRTNLTLKLLDLRNNNLQDTGCAHVCEGIAEQSNPKNSAYEDSSEVLKVTNGKTGLNSLVLWNNHITVSSSRHLALMVMATTSLETLNVGRNSITNDGIIRLKESLLRNKSLRRLYLHATKLSDEGAVALAEFIAESKTIERVDVRDNAIKVAGLLALAHSLRHNTSVVQMDIDSRSRCETVMELAEKHVSLLIEIREYTHRNRTQAHLATVENKDSDSEDYNMDPDFRKLSLSSEVSDGSQPQSLELPEPAVDTSVKVTSPTTNSNPGGEEHKKYRSPSPSPCTSPVPSPSLSPNPSPARNRFKVFKVSPDDSPTGPALVTANPLYAGHAESPLCSTSSSRSPLLSCSLPSLAPLSTTSRPVFYQPQVVVRNRFSSGGRFTVTKVNDPPGSLSYAKSKSMSLTQISRGTNDATLAEPSSPKIVISSPAKVERGFSLDEIDVDSVLVKENTLGDSLPNVSGSVETTTEGIIVSSHSPLRESCSSQDFLKKINSDSTESDDVFVESVLSPADRGSLQLATINGCRSNVGGLSTNAGARRELTDSGFLEEPNSEFDDSLSSLQIRPSASHDGDRDSLFSNTSDPGHSPLNSVPSDTVKDAIISPTTGTTATSRQTAAENRLSFKLPHPLNKDVLLSGNGALQCDDSKPLGGNMTLSPSAVQRAPLAAMENGSFDTDSEDSELTTQSSDSTHSDEVRITTADEGMAPVQAWGAAVATDVQECKCDPDGVQDKENAGSGRCDGDAVLMVTDGTYTSTETQ